MRQQLAALFEDVNAWLGWAPAWAISLILITFAAALAVIVHAGLVIVLRRAIPGHRVFLRNLLERVRGPMLLALFLFSVGGALQTAPLPEELVDALTHALLVAFIVLLGWAALVAIDLAADQYLQRFRLDVADNLLARKHTTQVRILERSAEVLVIVIAAAGALMTFESVRQYGVSIFASAGVAGIVVGLAARPVLSNLIAGVQIAVTQPLRIEDAVVVEGEWGWIEEITSTYIVIRIWDLRRLIVPLTYFVERPFQNWTRRTADLLAPIVLYLDYSVPVDAVRERLDEILADAPLWDGKVKAVQVTDARPDTIEVRVLVSARNSGDAWNLRCAVREQLIAFLQAEYPHALPRTRADVRMTSPVSIEGGQQDARQPAPAGG